MSNRAFAITGEENAVTGSYTTILDTVAATTVRPALSDVMLGCGSSVADQMLTYAIMRFTATPTVTAVTPTPLDSNTPAAVSTAGENASAEGTYTAASELEEMDFFMRATIRWVASPGSELIAPATASNGIGIRIKSAGYTGACKAQAHILEQ